MVSMEGDGCVFRAILSSRYPLEAHLARGVGQQGVESQLKPMGNLRTGYTPLSYHNATTTPRHFLALSVVSLIAASTL